MLILGSQFEFHLLLKVPSSYYILECSTAPHIWPEIHRNSDLPNTTFINTSLLVRCHQASYINSVSLPVAMYVPVLFFLHVLLVTLYVIINIIAQRKLSQ